MAKMQIDIIGNDKTKKAFNSLQNNVSKTEKSFFTLKNAIIAIAGSVVIKQVLNLSNEYQQLQNRIKLVTTSSQQLAQVQDELFAITRRTRGGFSETVELYQKLALQAGSLGLKQQDLLQITENVNKVIAIAGVGSVQASAGILQLSQAFASGRLQGDEFRSISENIPPLLTIFAKELGVTRGELKKLGSEGKITSEVIATALLKETENINDSFSKLSSTLGQATTVLGDSFLNLIGKFNETTGAADFLAEAMLKASQGIDKFAESLGNASDKVQNLKDDLVELQDQGLDLGALALKDPTGIFQTEITEQAIEDIKEAIDILDIYRDRIQLIAEGQIKNFAELDKIAEAEERVKEEKKKQLELQEKIIGQCKVEDSLQQDILNKIIKHNEQFNLASEIFTTMTETISSFSRGIARSIVLGEDMAETFKTIARNLLIEIIAKTIERIALLFIEKLIIEKIFKKQSDQLQKEKQITKEKQKQVALQMILVALGGGGGGGGLFGFAQGGAVSKGKPILVGENGPEIFRPNSTGQIEQNARGIGMNGATTFNFNISATDVKGVKELLLDNRATIVNAVNSALNEKGKEALV